jgi:hypothetical protein
VLSLTVKFSASRTYSAHQSISPKEKPEIYINMSIKVGNYLFTRLKQLGISTVFGVPGGTML